MGGTGKTSVTVEYAYRHLAELGLAWQFPAEDHEMLLADFARLAAQLGTDKRPYVRDPVASVHGVLARFPVDWLLVFDNVSGQDAVQRFLPPAGKGRVLITSQSARWPPGWAVEVSVLSTEAAATYLVNRTGDPDLRAADKLARELGGLPAPAAAVSCGAENPAGTVMLTVPGTGLPGAVYLNTNTSPVSPAVALAGNSFNVPGFAEAAWATQVAVSGTNSPAAAIAASTWRPALPFPGRNQRTRPAIMSAPRLPSSRRA